MATPIVPVLLSDLESILSTVTAAHSWSVTEDLRDSYRKLNRQNRGSAMTLALANAQDKLTDYIEEGVKVRPEETTDAVSD